MVRHTDTANESTSTDARTFGEWNDEDFVGDDGSGYDVTTTPTDDLYDEHARIAAKVREDDEDDDLRAFRRANLAAVTRELAYRRRSRVVPADWEDAEDAAVAMLEAREDVVDTYTSLGVHVTLTPEHTLLSSLLAPFDFDTTDVGVDDGNPTVWVRITGFGDAIDRTRSKHFMGEHTNPAVGASVLK